MTEVQRHIPLGFVSYLYVFLRSLRRWLRLYTIARHEERECFKWFSTAKRLRASTSCCGLFWFLITNIQISQNLNFFFLNTVGNKHKSLSVALHQFHCTNSKKDIKFLHLNIALVTETSLVFFFSLALPFPPHPFHVCGT